MPKEYFDIRNITHLNSVKPGGKIHLIGVAGVAMSQLAILLSRKGYVVSGSDKEFYEPTGSLLRASEIKLLEGYKRENIASDLDLVVIGNAVSYGHPEVAVVEERKIPYTSFPSLLAQLIIEGRHSIVVAGTHGKSTTTALIATLLERLGQRPSYFIGGVAMDLPHSLVEGRGRFSVVEGDEYDSAFFAKVPKFAFYKPDTAIINAIEFDHGDIYSDIEAIVKEFDSLAKSVPSTGTLIVCSDFSKVRELVPAWRHSLSCKIITFGRAEGSDYLIKGRVQRGGTQHLDVFAPNGKRFELTVPLIGEYNARNTLASLIALSQQGIPEAKIIEELKTFRSIKRRQEVILSNEKVVLIEDFAHHPTAVRETLQGVKEAYPERKVWAVFEPRSNTSRRKVFESEYIEGLALADRAIIFAVQVKPEVDSDQEIMDVDFMCRTLSNQGKIATAFKDVQGIKNLLKNEVGKGDVVVVMSNGSFGGLIDSLKEMYS